jgi:putative ABC transport system permease protein
MMTGLGHDLRYALRQIRRNPGFAAAAALTLALGIAATTTVFSFVDAALLRPLPYPEPGRLVVLWSERGEVHKETVSHLNFLDWRARGSAFEQLALHRRKRFNVGTDAGPERVAGGLVSANFFRTLGIGPMAGRDFADGEDRPGQDQVVLVSEGFWRRRLGADPAAVGRTVQIDGAPLSVIGVMPGGVALPADADIWVPISREPKGLLESRGLQGYLPIGRLRPGTTAARAQEQMAAVAAGLAAEYPQHNAGWSIRLEPLQAALSGDLRPTLLLLFGSAAILLLVAAVNLANMLLARASVREREIAVRRAIGAGEGRLVRQLLTENLVLAGLGGALGVLGAVWGVQAAGAAWQAAQTASPAAAVVDWRVVLFAAGITGTTALLFGLAPALRATRSSLEAMLRQGGTGAIRGRRLGRVLVGGEIALALVLGIGGSLLVRSLLRLQAVDPGFDPSGVVTARISLPEALYQEPSQVITFYRELLRETAALPGVKAAGAADAVPTIPGGGSYGFAIEGRPVPAVQEWPIAHSISATPDYFRALAIPLVEGRLFETADDSARPDVAVINQTLARRFWPDRSPIGARITFEVEQKHWVEIVGVVGDVRGEALGTPAQPQIYLAQPQWGDRAMSLVVRSAGDPLQLVGPIQAIVHRLNPELPLSEARTMEQALGASIVPQRLRTIIFGSFATLALLLAGIGIYGVMAYLVAQREREIAVRMALGAQRADVLGGVIGYGLRLAVPGMVLGLAGALVSARLLRSFLYEVQPADPVSLALVSAAVAVLVVVAALVPAGRAARTEPMAVLRGE